MTDFLDPRYCLHMVEREQCVSPIVDKPNCLGRMCVHQWNQIAPARADEGEGLLGTDLEKCVEHAEVAREASGPLPVRDRLEGLHPDSIRYIIEETILDHVFDSPGNRYVGAPAERIKNASDFARTTVFYAQVCGMHHRGVDPEPCGDCRDQVAVQAPRVS